ncbi:MAG: DNA translocase FtsK [Dehalococcoidia bacterium]|nr:DNA translocase FtsK [Dehalococcoidia bacterium]
MPSISHSEESSPYSTTKPRTSAASRRAARNNKATGFRRHLWLITHLLPVLVALGPVLAFTIPSGLSDWAFQRLGFGLFPTLAWFSSVVLLLRYRSVKEKWVWGVLAGFGVIVALSLSILSMFEPATGRLNNVSLGGSWGSYLGGFPLALGAAKALGILLAGPLLLYPKTGLRAYRLAVSGAYSQVGDFLRWSLGRTGDESDGPSKQTATAMKTVSAPKKEAASPSKQASKGSAWQLPPLDLLSQGMTAPVPQSVLAKMAGHIEETLADHRVDVKVEDIRTGPRVIRFGLVPGWMKRQGEAQKGRTASTPLGAEASRVRVQSILAREKDLALALKTPYLRMEAPVPGEALVGLEVPNPHANRVYLRSLAESPNFQKLASKGTLPIAIGEDTGGTPVVSDLTALPHLLIAGATGSGKSVCINAVIASMLLTNRPDRLRMIMVDPKRVELTPFNGIPNLVLPVIVDADKVLDVLKGVQNEMLRRYKLLEEAGARNLNTYNSKSKEPMPYLVVVIDELADLMMTAAFEVEQALVRLAQLGRATGIHLILATQRPSVNVVTGLLKANVPARIAFAVASQVDSRVILDAVGAERLLGKGDMLLLSQDSPKPVRVQGTYVDDDEIEELVSFWKNQSGPPLPQIVLEDSEEKEEAEALDDDSLLESARELAERSPNISPSVLQRRLQVGYAKAVQLTRQMEAEGVLAKSSSSSSEPPW